METSLKQKSIINDVISNDKMFHVNNPFTHLFADAPDHVYMPIYHARELIKKKYEGLGGLLGKATSDVQEIKNPELLFKDSGVYIQNFEFGCIIATHLPASNVYEIHGDIYRKWNEMGREKFGLPLTDEEGTPDRIGRYNHFTNGKSIYWSPDTGAHVIYGAIRHLWASLGWETSTLGYPTSDEITAPDNIGRINYFQKGAIYFSSTTGAIILQDVITWEANIHFSDGTALGGYAKLVANKNGDCTFSGHLHDSGFDPYSFTVMGVIMTPSGIGYSVVYSGHTEGTSSNLFGSPNRNDDWTVSINHPSIRDNWAQVNIAISQFRTTAQDKFASNVQDTINDIAKDAVKAFAGAAVKGLIALI